MASRYEEAAAIGDRFHDWVITGTKTLNVGVMWEFVNDDGERTSYITAHGFPLTRRQAESGLREMTIGIRQRKAEAHLAMEYARMC